MNTKCVASDADVSPSKKSKALAAKPSTDATTVSLSGLCRLPAFVPLLDSMLESGDDVEDELHAHDEEDVFVQSVVNTLEINAGMTDNASAEDCFIEASEEMREDVLQRGEVYIPEWLKASQSIKTRLTFTPWDSISDKEDVVDSDDELFLDHDTYSAKLWERLYRMSVIDDSEDEGFILVGKFTWDDTRFSFNSDNIFAYKHAVGKVKANDHVRIWIIGSIKQACQWKSNLSMGIVPFIRCCWANAKAAILNHSEGKPSFHFLPCLFYVLKLPLVEGVKSPCIASDHIPLAVFTPKGSFDCIFDASHLFSPQFKKNKRFNGELLPSHIILADCFLQRFSEKETSLKKAAFKISSIGVFGQGDVPLASSSTVGTSPSKKKFCMSFIIGVSVWCVENNILCRVSSSSLLCTFLDVFSSMCQ
ncbi:uncharacterized protein EI90DRAFT_3128465 [Cantharellus anzutake]|uniref:uncharacterized protein n=1 Tax=Cantharellus anzutake TaxID=1750568 RepID=UPI001906C819|nr:uncharacterized protein EI90DRAFT_3128465 [Cantharellus anzutake]KAF8325614.1 hypothetical protein EI90DRAFT_3128465 [Cantharellus anzutake]